MIDFDGDNKLSEEEFKTLLRQVGEGCTAGSASSRGSILIMSICSEYALAIRVIHPLRLVPCSRGRSVHFEALGRPLPCSRGSFPCTQ